MLYCPKLIEALLVKSIAPPVWELPKLCKKGAKAEVNTVAACLSGNSKNIRLVVAEMRRAIQHTIFVFLGDSRFVFRLSFFIL
jgi:hypothetical protein